VELTVITVTAFIASAITLFSGFGLGTVLMPAFALFFPIPVAIAATAIVHLTNNLFKLGLLGRQADWQIVLRFALPAAVAAILGAGVLLFFAEMPILTRYELFGRGHEVTALKLVIGALIIGFALAELSPAFSSLTVPRKYVAWGGLLSGFFGGLSGNQGVFRSAFLVTAVDTKEAFVATGVVCAVIVDITRLAVYGLSYVRENIGALPSNITGLVLSAMLAAFAGAYFAKRLLKKVTYRTIRVFVSAAMIFIGAGLAAGAI